jgi:neprilysin
VKSTVIHDRYGEQGFSTALTDKAEEKIRKILNSPVTDDDIRPFQLAKKSYRMCVNHDQLDKDGANPLFELIEKLGGWELITRNPRESQLNWQELYEKVLANGFISDYLMSIYLATNPKNTTSYTIKITPPSKEDFNRGYYDLLPQGLNSTLVAAYYDYMKEFTELIGATEEDAKREMLEVLEFEQKLFKVIIVSKL